MGVKTKKQSTNQTKKLPHYPAQKQSHRMPSTKLAAAIHSGAVLPKWPVSSLSLPRDVYVLGPLLDCLPLCFSCDLLCLKLQMEWWPRPSRKCHLMTSLLTAACTALSASCQQLTHFPRLRVRPIIYTELRAQLPLQTTCNENNP